MNGYCIAGIDIDSGEWIRPVSLYSYGELGSREITVEGSGARSRRPMETLDVIRLRLGKQVRSAGQPENWELDLTSRSMPHPILGQGANDASVLAQIRDLAKQSSSSSLLLGTQGKDISHREIQKEPLSHSLCVIRPKGLTWVRTTNFKNKPRIEGWFDFGGRNVSYYLSLTDIAWEAKLLAMTVNDQSLDASEVPGVDPNLEILLTISLGDLFEKTRCHYKLIAGVLLLPRN
jgi:hypothetical protein